MTFSAHERVFSAAPPARIYVLGRGYAADVSPIYEESGAQRRPRTTSGPKGRARTL